MRFAKISPLFKRLNQARAGEPMVIASAGSGLLTRCAAAAGIDAIMALSAGLYRNLGGGSLASFLPYGNANVQTLSLLKDQILPRCASVPVIAGVLSGDPSTSDAETLEVLGDLGVQGVVNWPALGFVDGNFRAALEAEGCGIAVEAQMLAEAGKQGFVTFGFCLGPEEIDCFVQAGVNALILDVGLTRETIDVWTRKEQVERSISRLNFLIARARSLSPQVALIAFGGTITSPEDLAEVFRHSQVQGFAGGSVFERLPVEDVLSSTMRRFKGVALARGAVASAGPMGDMLGDSPAMQKVFELVRRIGPQDVSVCIEGESGTGKELIATHLHRLSRRASQPFVTLNCGAIPDGLLESELFGHERGAFTGAERRRPGKFELAHRGTLFLDEIADLSARGQVALLRVLQQREVMRVGGDLPVAADVRVIAASNRPLSALVQTGDFRADLYFRLNSITITAPPLRQRAEDIPLLVESFLSELRVKLARDVRGISKWFERRLMQHVWPGNVRELQQTICQAAILEDGKILEGLNFEPRQILSYSYAEERANRRPSVLADGPLAVMDRSPRRQKAERAVQDCSGNKRKAAEMLGVTRKTLYRWLAESPVAVLPPRTTGETAYGG